MGTPEPRGTEELRKIYRGKVLNQELALKEFAERKLTLQSRPSKLLVELGERGQPPMRAEIFDKVCPLFDTAYFADLRGLDYALADRRWEALLEKIEDHPLINWHSVTHLQLDRPETWKRLARIGLMFGVFIQAATPETARIAAPQENFKLILDNMALISEALGESKKGFMYMIVLLKKESIGEMPRFIGIAHQYRVPEVQFKIITTVDQIERQFPVSAELIDQTLDLAISRGIRATLNDQDLARNADPEKMIRATKAPYSPTLNFPPGEPIAEREFERQHAWRGIDQKVLERSKVSVYQKCFKPFHYLHVSRVGEIGPCNHLMYPPLKLGSLITHDFEQIWNGPEYQEFRRKLVSRQPEDPRCQWCFKHRIED